MEAIRKKKTVGGTFCGKYYCGESVVCDRLSIYVPMETYFKYDPYGRLTGVGDKQISYDDNGRPLNYLGTEIEWDGSRMKKYGSSEYEYDGDNCRLSKTVKGKKRLFFYDVQNALRVERTEEGEIHYLYDASGVRGFEYVEYSVPGAALSRVKYYYEKDLQGNIVGIVNSEGTEIVKYEYVDAWGSFNESYLTDEGRVVASLNSFTYRGYYYDKESGLYYPINRYYDPVTGRFISPDDVGYLDFESFFGTNRYAYCLDNPVMCVDPEGKFWVTLLIVAGVGAVIAGTTSVVMQLVFDHDVNWKDVGIAAVFGAISAVLSFTGIGGVAGQAVLNGLLSVCENLTSAAINQTWDEIDGTIILDFLFSGLMGMVGAKDAAKDFRRFRQMEKSMTTAWSKNKGWAYAKSKSRKYIKKFVRPYIKEVRDLSYINVGYGVIKGFIDKKWLPIF